MSLDPLTTTHFERHLSAVFAVKELIQSQKVDGYDFMVDTLLVAFYGLEDVLHEIKRTQREEHIRQMAKMQKEQR